MTNIDPPQRGNEADDGDDRATDRNRRNLYSGDQPPPGRENLRRYFAAGPGGRRPARELIWLGWDEASDLPPFGTRYVNTALPANYLTRLSELAPPPEAPTPTADDLLAQISAAFDSTRPSVILASYSAVPVGDFWTLAVDDRTAWVARVETWERIRCDPGFKAADLTGAIPRSWFGFTIQDLDPPRTEDARMVYLALHLADRWPGQPVTYPPEAYVDTPRKLPRRG